MNQSTRELCGPVLEILCLRDEVQEIPRYCDVVIVSVNIRGSIVNSGTLYYFICEVATAVRENIRDITRNVLLQLV